MAEFNQSRLFACSCFGVLLGYLASGCSSTSATGTGPGVGGSGIGGAAATGGNSAGGGTAAIGGAASTGGANTSASSSTPLTGGASNLGGNSATGGKSNAGGTSGSGGATTTGGSNATGGTKATGGGTATGGSNATGGTNNTGGSNATGGTKNTGGTSSSGGVSSTVDTKTGTGGMNTGGTVTTGGTQATGGTTSTGGTTATGGSGTAGVRIVGRTATGTAAGSVRFSWPGVNINARFTGTQVSMDLNDGSNKNRFTVVVDNGTPKTVTTSSSTSLQLASGLTDATHDIVIWRNTEASPGGVTEFRGLSGFSSGGGLVAPAAAPDRRIEVIGDSLSAGAGVEGTSTTCSPNIDAFTNNYLAYGSVAARSVKADLVTIAWSGIGVYRSYSSSDPTMPDRYDYAIASDKTAWDFSKYQPHVVVINLGTNDFGSGNPGQAYVDAYVNFVKHVRSKYASANFILIDMYGGERVTAINSVVSALKSGGESKVEMLSFNSVQNSAACNQHPNTSAQNAMGGVLATRLKSLMSW